MAASAFVAPSDTRATPRMQHHQPPLHLEDVEAGWLGC
jgi:hypothetical protein